MTYHKFVAAGWEPTECADRAEAEEVTRSVPEVLTRRRAREEAA